MLRNSTNKESSAENKKDYFLRPEFRKDFDFGFTQLPLFSVVPFFGGRALGVALF